MSRYLAVNIGEAFKIGDQGIANKPGYENLGTFLSPIIRNIYVIAGLILFFLILGGGFAIISSGGNPQQKAQGGKAITSAIIGFLIIFASFWIIQIIQFLTGIKIFNPGV
jgi:hypothetical protein